MTSWRCSAMRLPASVFIMSCMHHPYPHHLMPPRVWCTAMFSAHTRWLRTRTLKTNEQVGMQRAAKHIPRHKMELEIAWSFSSFSWKWLMVVCWKLLSMYCCFVSLERGAMAGSCRTLLKYPPYVKHLAIPIAPIASNLHQRKCS